MAGEKIFLNPFTDFGFKKLFGEEGSKDLLIDFLNQLLPEQHQIDSLIFMKSEAFPDTQEERQAVFDIHCKSTNGEVFIVEMQKAKVKYFKDRALYYTTFPIKEQAQKGEWDFYLEPVYLIAILDFELSLKHEKKNEIRVDVALKDQHGDLFYEKLHFCFLQMPLFDKKEDELETQFDKWLFFLKNLENFAHIPTVLNEPLFKKGFEIARLANLKPSERDQYNESVKKYLDMMNVIETAKEESFEKGLEKGFEKGIREERIQVAINALKRGLAIEEIAAITGLTLSEIKELKSIKD